MDFYILPAAVVTLCYAALLLSFAAYLIARQWRSVAARWLAAFCITFIMTYGVWYVPSLVLPMHVGEAMSFWVYFFGMAGLSPFAIALQQFVYAFRGNPYPREARVLLLLTGAVTLFFTVLFLSPLWQKDLNLFELGGRMAAASFLTVVLISLWTIVVAARKTVRFSRDAQRLALEPQAGSEKSGAWSHLWRPRGRAARACRAFAAVMCFPFLMMFMAGLQWGVGLASAVLIPLLVTCVFAFLYSIIVAYVTYTPEATTVQVKLVGTVLATVLLLLALVGTILIDPSALMQQHGGVTPAPHTLRFEPDGRGGYAVTHRPLDPAQRPIRPLGERLPLGDDDEVAVPVGFAFPFYGAAWDSMSVSANGAIGLGGPVKGPRSVNFVPGDLLRGAAKLAPLFADFTAAPGGVFVQRTPDQVHVTWHEVGLVGGAPEARYTLRATLDRSGAVTFRYTTPAGQLLAASPGGLAGRGLVPGGDALAGQTLEPGRSLAGAPGAALVETFAEPVYREAHRFGRKLFILLVASTLFCLLVLPLIFRASLLRPLARLLGGLQEVEKGHLDTAVQVPTHDEVGRLAQHFNAMTHTLREAEHQLKEYAATLEHKVDARTAELSRSLEELKTAQARLVHAEKMASLGALTAGIAHEIKNPLNFVNNFAALSRELAEELEAETDPDEIRTLLADLKTNAAKIEEHGQRADGIVRAMLDHSRGGTGERRPADLNALVSEYVDLAYHGKRAQVPDFNAEIEKQLGSEVGEVEVVPQEIGRVLLNLIGNAFDAVYEQAAAANGQAYAPRVTVSTRRVGEHVEIRVVDNGPGIPEDVRAKIFEPFFTTKPTGSGTGLGLSLSYDIVTQGHGGTLAAESTPGQGAAFVMRLPAA